MTRPNALLSPTGAALHPSYQPERRRALSRMGGLAAGAMATLAGCSSLDPSLYALQTPTFSLRKYFNGDLDAWGLFQDRFGKVQQRMTVAMTGTWQGSTGTLDEHFTYADGRTERRIWTLEEREGGQSVGTASDVIGQAQGQAHGNALHWRYTLALPIQGRVWHVDVDDWMFLIDERILLNRARMSKWGLTLGEVFLSFSRRSV
jgi:hypothetical protein